MNEIVQMDDWIKGTIEYGSLIQQYYIVKMLLGLTDQSRDDAESTRTELVSSWANSNKSDNLESTISPHLAFQTSEEFQNNLQEWTEQSEKLLGMIENYKKTAPSKLVNGLEEELGSMQELCREPFPEVDFPECSEGNVKEWIGGTIRYGALIYEYLDIELTATLYDKNIEIKKGIERIKGEDVSNQAINEMYTENMKACRNQGIVLKEMAESFISAVTEYKDTAHPMLVRGVDEKLIIMECRAFDLIETVKQNQREYQQALSNPHPPKQQN